MACFFSSRTLGIKRNWHFSKNSRDSVCLRIGDRKRKVYLKREDRKRILLSKVGTRKEFWSENWDRKRIVISKQGTGKIFPVPILRYTILFRSLLLRVKFFSGPQFWNHFSFPVPSFEIHFSFLVPYSETDTISRISKGNRNLFLFLKIWGERTMTQWSVAKPL